ncbi:MAG: hypothetical protein Q8J84_10325 [Flavobacteriaceae bacterium]|nr:hypothetical protein [Flavobacteriaceae bacterium]
MNLKKITAVLIVSVLLAVFSSCSKDEVSGNVSLKAKSINNSTANKLLFNSKNATAFTISSFKINIGEIEFEIEDQDDSKEDLYGDFELKGPFELDLSNGNLTIDITTVELPDNVYSEIEFDLKKSTNANSALFGKSIEIRGTLNGLPFVFWHDVEDEFEVDYANNSSNITVAGNKITAIIEFNLDAIFGAASSIDFSKALDRDGDGVIEINPRNDDGNASIANEIKNLLKENSNLHDD